MKIIMAALLVLVSCGYANAHAIWIETSPVGKTGKTQEAKIFLGEYAANERDSIQNWFGNMASFTLWLVTPDGQRTALKTEAKGNYFLASFTPASEGVYFLSIDHPVDQVYDGTKIHYHAQAAIQVGKSRNGAENVANLNNAVMLQKNTGYRQGSDILMSMTFNNAAIAGSKLNVQSTEGWTKEIDADAKSSASFKPLWKDLYLLEGTFTEEKAGKHKDQEYKAVWHCITNCVQVD